MAWVRVRTRKDGTAYSSFYFRENGQQTSVSWNDHGDAQRFADLVNRLGAAKAREITRIVASTAKTITVTEWLTQHNDTITGLEAGTLTPIPGLRAQRHRPRPGRHPAARAEARRCRTPCRSPARPGRRS